MDRIDDMLTRYFAAGAEPPRRTLRPSVDPAGLLAALADRIGIEAGSRGVRALTLAGDDEIAPGGRDYARRARREVMEFLAGRRTFFSVPVDLEGVGDFQARVLASAKAIPYGDVRSYAQLAAGIGAPRAARAVGNALAANPVPLGPCVHVRQQIVAQLLQVLLLVIHGGGQAAQALVQRRVPLLVGCVTTRIVCRRGCAHEQRIGEARRVVFASVGDARSVGYRPCRTCRPAA